MTRIEGSPAERLCTSFTRLPLELEHTVFGKVVKGMGVVKSIRDRDPGSDPNPGDLIETIVIQEK